MQVFTVIGYQPFKPLQVKILSTTDNEFVIATALNVATKLNNYSYPTTYEDKILAGKVVRRFLDEVLEEDLEKEMSKTCYIFHNEVEFRMVPMIVNPPHDGSWITISRKNVLINDSAFVLDVYKK